MTTKEVTWEQELKDKFFKDAKNQKVVGQIVKFIQQVAKESEQKGRDMAVDYVAAAVPRSFDPSYEESRVAIEREDLQELLEAARKTN